MNKCLIFFLSIVPFFCYAQQVNLSVWSNNHVQINSYSGVVSTNAFTVKLDGNGALSMPTWRISVRVKDPITNGSQVFPANKISLIPTTTYGQFNPNNIPTVSQIGMPMQTILAQNQEVFLVPQSQAGLYNTAAGNVYFNLHMLFDLKAEGGAYLSAFTTWSTFNIPMEFKFYDEKNKIKGTINQNYNLQIGQLSGMPPETNVLSLKVAPQAKQSLINIVSLTDYRQGTQLIVPNGLIVKATTDYQLKVRSINANFVSQNGNTLPLSIVHLTLNPVAGTLATLFPIQLSSGSQRIANGLSTQGNTNYYDIKYSTQANDVNLYQAKMEEYSTVLQYEIMPQ